MTTYGNQHHWPRDLLRERARGVTRGIRSIRFQVRVGRRRGKELGWGGGGVAYENLLKKDEMRDTKNGRQLVSRTRKKMMSEKSFRYSRC